MRKQTSHGLESPACSGAQEVRDIVELRDLLFTEIDLFLKLIDGPVEFVTCISLEHFNEVAIAKCPDVFLLLGVFKTFDRVFHLVVHGHLGDFSPSGNVDRVTETWVVCILNAITFRQYPLANIIKVVDVNREPRNGF